MSQKQELIEQNDGHFWIHGSQITLIKLLYTLQQTEIFCCRPVLFLTTFSKSVKLNNSV